MMDIGDIFRLIFFAFIFLSFFGGGLFSRNRSGNAEEGDQPAPRPTDISQSGGQDPRQRPQQQRQQTPQRPQERQMPTTASEWWEELTGQRTQQQPAPAQPRREPERQIVTYDDAIEQEPPRQEQRRQQSARSAVREGERELLEQDITDMPPPMDTQPRRRRRTRDVSSFSVSDSRRKRTGGDVLRGSLRNPDTLERAFILKEVLDEPIAMRDKR